MNLSDPNLSVLVSSPQWLVQALLDAADLRLAAAVAAAVGFFVLIREDRNARIVTTTVAVALAMAMVGKSIRLHAEAELAQAAQRKLLDTAQAVFAERCKQAGETILTRANGVQGVFLVNLRTKVDAQNQNDRNDPAGDAATGDDYIQSLVLPDGLRPAAFAFVETPAGDGGEVLRYTDGRAAGDDKAPPLASERVKAREARYAIEWRDISTPQDRQYWIAGGTIRITDLETQELLAERVGFIMDPAQGDKNAERKPWAEAVANACPTLPKPAAGLQANWGLTRAFVAKVLSRGPQ